MKSCFPDDDKYPKSISAQAPDTLAGHELTDAERAAYSSLFLDTSATTTTNTTGDAKPPFETHEQLIEHCRYCMLRLLQFDDCSVCAPDFYFRGPVVGPVTLEEFRGVFARFKIRDGLTGPGTSHNLWVDPHCPRRVFWVSVTDAVNTGDIGPYKATGKRVRSPPQVSSFTFDDEGKITRFTGGYVLDRDVGNTGGLGALFGIVYAIGHAFPMPEAKPYVKSWQFRLLELVDRFTSYFRAPVDTKAIEAGSKSD